MWPGRRAARGDEGGGGLFLLFCARLRFVLEKDVFLAGGTSTRAVGREKCPSAPVYKEKKEAADGCSTPHRCTGCNDARPPCWRRRHRAAAPRAHMTRPVSPRGCAGGWMGSAGRCARGRGTRAPCPLGCLEGPSAGRTAAGRPHCTRHWAPARRARPRRVRVLPERSRRRAKLGRRDVILPFFRRPTWHWWPRSACVSRCDGSLACQNKRQFVDVGDDRHDDALAI